MPAQTVIKIRRDTSTNWDAVNPTLAAGEIAFETDTNKIKVGDGSTVWASLDYASGAGTAAEISYDNVDAELIATTVKGALDELSLTKADVSQLSTNLAVFATTVASDISGYNVLVSSVDNPDYNDTAVDVPTGAINADNQLIASLAASADLFEGQVDPITVTTIGNIRKTSGNQNQSASFYFEVYVRNAAGTETLVGTSDDTGEVNPPNSDYLEFSASAFVSFGTVLDTDRIVLKFYGNVADGSGAEYDFQFGGGNPVRTLLPVPATVAVAHIASSVEVDTTNFDGVLSGSDTTVQAALETLDDLDISAGVITSDSPPSSPSNGDLWWESDTGILYIYYDNFWVEAVAGIVGPQGETGAVVSDTEPTDESVLWVDTSTSATPESTLTNGTAGYTALSNGTAGLSYQPVSHNYIINGGMDIAQRGTSVTGIDGNGYYLADRWNHLQSSAGTLTATLESDAPAESGAINSYKLNTTTAKTPLDAGSYFALRTMLENTMLSQLKKGSSDAQQVTVSFWTKSNVTGTFIVELDDNSNNRNISSSYTISSADTWEYKTVTFDADTTGALPVDGRFELLFWLAAGTNFSSGTLQTSWGTQSNADRAVGQVNLVASVSNYFQLTGVQLEAGSIATPFKRNANSIQGELAACQRYYENVGDSQQIWNGDVTSGAKYRLRVMFAVPKRTDSPTVTTTDKDNNRFPSGAPGASSINRFGFRIDKTANSTGSSGLYVFDFVAEDEL